MNNKYIVTIVLVTVLGAVGVYYISRPSNNINVPPLQSGTTQATLSPSWVGKLPNGYKIKDDKLYYGGKVIDSANADLSSLVAASDYLEGGSYYLKDVKSVYLGAGSLILLNGVDSATFNTLGCVANIGCYSKDRNNVYLEDLGNHSVVVGADLESFRLATKSEYVSLQIDAVDINHQYFLGKPIATMKKSDLQEIGGGYLKDTKSIYKETRIGCGGDMCDGPIVLMSQYDLNTFRFIGECRSNQPADRAPDIDYYVADKNGVYCGDELVKGLNPSTFKI